MPDKTYLGKEGTKELIKKTKELVPSKTSQLTNDSNFETKEDVQTQLQNIEKNTDPDLSPASGYIRGDAYAPTYELGFQNQGDEDQEMVYDVETKKLTLQSNTYDSNCITLTQWYKPALGIDKVVDVDADGNETENTDYDHDTSVSEVVSKINVDPTLSYDEANKVFSANRGVLGDIKFQLKRNKNQLQFVWVESVDDDGKPTSTNEISNVLDLNDYYYPGDSVYLFGGNSSLSNNGIYVGVTPTYLYTSDKLFCVTIPLSKPIDSSVSHITIDSAQFQVVNSSDTVFISKGQYASKGHANIFDGTSPSVFINFSDMSLNRTSYNQVFVQWIELKLTFS